MFHGGHIGAVASIGLLLVSTAFLMWVDGKAGNTYQKLGKIVGAVALALSALLVIGSVATCIYRIASGPDVPRGCPMMQMMEEGRGMGPGPGMHRRGMMGQGMGPVGMPPQAPAAPQAPEKEHDD